MLLNLMSWYGHLIIEQQMYQLDIIFMLKYFLRGATKIYLCKYLMHEYFHTLKFPNLQ